MSKQRVTAKVTCLEAAKDAEGRYVTLRFSAHYTDREGNRVNQDWAYATPSLGMHMVVQPEVAALFDVEGTYTITFTPDASESDG